MNAQTITDEERRRLAVAALIGRPLSESLPELFLAMGDASWRVRKEAVETLLAADNDLGEELVPRLVKLLEAEENAGLRNSASEALERLGARAVGGLCAAIGTADPDARKFVIDILGAIADPAAVPALLAALDDPEPNVVSAVVETLGKIGDAAAGPHLIALLARDDLFLRFAVLEALSQIKCPVPLDVIASLAENPLLKKAAFNCLGAIGSIEAVPMLIAGLADKGRSAREAAVMGLMSLRDRMPERDMMAVDTQLQQLADTSVLETLLSSLSSAELLYKRSLIRLLGLSRDGRAMIPLLQAAHGEDVCRECLRAIQEIGAAGVDALIAYFPMAQEGEQQQILQCCVALGIRTCGPILADGARASNVDVRQQAILAIGQLDLTDSLALVVEALDDEDETVQHAAVKALASLAQHAADVVRPVAIRLAESASPHDRMASAHLLLQVGCDDRLHFLIKDEEANVRLAAVYALSRDCSDQARHAISLAIMDEKPEVRIAAANALGACGGEKAVDSLLVLLSDPDQRVQRAALRNLGLLGDPKAGPVVEQLIPHAAGLLRIHAMESLVAISGSSSAAVIEQQLQHADEEVVKAAISLLAATNPQRLAEYHLHLLQHRNWEVRSSMARALGDALGAEAAPLLRVARATEQDEFVKSQLTLLLDRIA